VSDDKQPLWSPDGSRILFISDRSGSEALWAMEVRDGKPRGRAESLAADVGHAVLGLTAAGGLVHVKGGLTRNVYIADVGVDLKSTGTYEILSERIVNVNSTPAWSPDGESVAYYSTRGNQDLIGSTVVVIRSMKSGEEREIPLAIRVPTIHQTGLRWFSDGKSLLVIGRDVATPGRTVYKVDIASGKLEALKQINGQGIPGNQPQITPDGRTLIYAEGGQRLVRFDIDSGQETQLAEGWFGSLSLSPDGTQLVVVGNTVNADFRFNQVVVIPLVGTAERRVLFESSKWNDGSRFNSIGWSHDQRYVLFVRDDGNKGGNILWRVPTAGGPVEPTGIVVKGRIKAPGVHPKGGKLTFSAVNETPQEVWILENFLPRS
jgi:Tol biopolymer transport system component